MKIGDTVMSSVDHWKRLGLILGFEVGYVLVFWGEDFPCEKEYPEQLQVV